MFHFCSCLLGVALAAYPVSQIYYGSPLTPAGRLVQSIPSNMIETSDPIIRNLLSQVSFMDESNDPFTPNLNIPDSTGEYTPEGWIHLGNVMSQSFHRVVFSVINNTNRTIVYQHDCEPDGSWSSIVHPLISRYAYSAAAQEISAEPPILFISPPTPFRKSWKTKFLMTEDEFEMCIFSGATVRYAIMSLEAIAAQSRIVSFNNIVKNIHRTKQFYKLFFIGARLVSMLKTLHLSHQLVHGNLKPANIVVQFTGTTTTDFEFRLIDFCRAAWLNTTTGLSGRRNDAGFRSFSDISDSIWMSPWEIKDDFAHTYSSQDDVFRLLEIIAQSFRTTIDLRPDMLSQGILYDFKAYGKLFDDEFFSRWHGSSRFPEIVSHMSALETLARKDTAVPHYDEIVYHLSSVGRALEAAT